MEGRLPGKVISNISVLFFGIVFDENFLISPSIMSVISILRELICCPYAARFSTGRVGISFIKSLILPFRPKYFVLSCSAPFRVLIALVSSCKFPFIRSNLSNMQMGCIKSIKNAGTFFLVWPTTRAGRASYFRDTTYVNGIDNSLNTCVTEKRCLTVIGHSFRQQLLPVRLIYQKLAYH